MFVPPTSVWRTGRSPSSRVEIANGGVSAPAADTAPGGDVERTTKRLLTKAKQTAEEVAGIVHAGVERGDFLILTDKAGRQAYLAKRLMPSTMFARIVEKRAKRVMEKRPGTPDA